MERQSISGQQDEESYQLPGQEALDNTRDTYDADKPVIGLFKCPHCPTTLKNKRSFEEHLRFWNERQKCKLKKYYAVLDEATNTPVFQCFLPGCKVRTTSRTLASQHAKQLHEPTTEDKELYKISKPGPTRYNNGRRLAADEPVVGQYKCDFCPKTFTEKHYLKWHLNVREKNKKCRPCKYYAVLDEETKAPIFLCGIRGCGVKTNSRKIACAHADKYHHNTDIDGKEYQVTIERIKRRPKRKFVCDDCGAVYTTEDTLKRHLDRKKKNGDICPPVPRPPELNPLTNAIEYPCKFKECNATFSTSNLRTLHHLKHRFRPEDFIDVNKEDHHSNLCHICGRFLHTNHFRKHLTSHELDNSFGFRNNHEMNKTITENGVEVFTCNDCNATRKSCSAMSKHYIVHHKILASHSPPTLQQARLKNPLIHWNGFNMREEIPFNFRDFNTLKHELNWFHSWLEIYLTEHVRKYDYLKSGVYICAVLDKDYKDGNDVHEYMTNNPNSIIAIYVGSDAKNSKNISGRHWNYPESSCLAQHAEQGNKVVCLKREIFQGKWEQKTKEMKAKEAYLIELLKTDELYVPISGIQQLKILNVQLERHSLQLKNDQELHTLYKHALTGVKTICYDKSCDSLCDAIVHPDWDNEHLLVDFTNKKRKRSSQDQLSEYPSNPTKKLRPNNSAELDYQIQIHIEQFKQTVQAYDPRFYTYTIMTLSKEKFKDCQTAEEYCNSIVARRNEDLSIGIYVGISSMPYAGFHHKTNLYSSVLKDIKKGDRVAIHIHTSEFATRGLAKKNEALRIMFLFIQRRFRKKGIKFNPLNQLAEWLSLSLCSKEEIKQYIRRGLIGMSPIDLGDDNSSSRAFNSYNDIVNLQHQISMGKVSIYNIDVE